MARISVSHDELKEIASRLALAAQNVRDQLDPALSDLHRLKTGWVGGRAAPLVDALATADKTRTELIAALEALASYVAAAQEAYEQSEIAADSAFGQAAVPPIPARPLLELLGFQNGAVSPSEIERRWQRKSGGLIPIGVADDGQVGIDLQEAASVVVCGTTGSGKTELLRTLVTSMALNFSPRDVAFVLVDFKGGGAFGELAHLPHTIAVVSNLDTGYIRRWLVQTQAELYRRQEAGDSLVQHLVIVVDEFASLRLEEPGSDALIGRIASVGRSLRVHLVVGSQLASVIPETLRASATTRIALRMVSRHESIGFLGEPGAEALAGHGYGYLCRLNDASRRFRAAAPLGPEDTLRVVRAAAVLGRDRWGVMPWPAPLPANVALDALPRGEDGLVPIGVVDLPRELTQDVMYWRPRTDGHLLIWGPPGSGKSTALQAVAQAARRAGLRTLPDATEGSLRVRDIRTEADLSRLIRDIRNETSGVDRHPLIVLLDGLDESQLETASDGLLGRVLRVISGPLSDRARLVVTSRQLRLAGDNNTQRHFGVVVQLAPWLTTPEDSDRQRSFVTARVPGRGLWNGNEVQLANPDLA